jgi:hypothetical protein
MMRNASFGIIPALVVLILSAGSLMAQRVLYEDHFTGGAPDIAWESVWADSLGTPLTPMGTDSVPVNPSGDGWIGIVEADTASLGGLGLAVAGSDTLTDYSMEAQVWVDVTDASFYEGIMVRTNVDTATGVAQGYQLVSNFYPSFFLSRVKFRKYSSQPDDIHDLAVFDNEDIPGGEPTSSGWHTFKIDAQGDLFWLYWDGMEFPNNPQVDTTGTPPLLSGNFGVYIFNLGYGRTGVDDIIVEGGGPTGLGDSPGGAGLPKAFSLSQNYPNPFNPMTTIRVDVPAGPTEHATLAIYDLRGRRVRTLVDRPLEPGTHLFAWDGRDDDGRPVSSGTYIYRMKRGDERSSKKMILAK